MTEATIVIEAGRAERHYWSDLWRYRTVAQFAVGPDGAIGFRRANSRDVLDMPTCPLVHPALDTLYQTMRAWIRGHWGGAAASYSERFTVRVAANAPVSIRRMKEMAAKGGGLPLAAALRLDVGPNPYLSEDRAEGIAAYLEGRPPRWRNR